MNKFQNNQLLSNEEIDRIFELKATHDLNYIQNKIRLAMLSQANNDTDKNNEYDPEKVL